MGWNESVSFHRRFPTDVRDLRDFDPYTWVERPKRTQDKRSYLAFNRPSALDSNQNPNSGPISRCGGSLYVNWFLGFSIVLPSWLCAILPDWFLLRTLCTVLMFDNVFCEWLWNTSSSYVTHRSSSQESGEHWGGYVGRNDWPGMSKRASTNHSWGEARRY